MSSAGVRAISATSACEFRGLNRLDVKPELCRFGQEFLVLHREFEGAA